MIRRLFATLLPLLAAGYTLAESDASMVTPSLADAQVAMRQRMLSLAEKSGKFAHDADPGQREVLQAVARMQWASAHSLMVTKLGDCQSSKVGDKPRVQCLVAYSFKQNGKDISREDKVQFSPAINPGTPAPAGWVAE